MQKYQNAIIALLSFYSVNWITDMLSLLVLVFYNPYFVTSILTGEYTEEQQAILHSPTVIGTTQLIASIIILLFLFRTGIVNKNDNIRTKSLNWKHIIIGLTGAFIIQMAVEQLLSFLLIIARNETLEFDDSSYYFGIMYTIYLAFFSPLVEETIFRGGILGNLIKNGINKWWAIVISAAIFGAAHFDFDRLLPCFAFGIVTGWIYTRTKSLIPSVCLHIANNMTCLILLIYGKSNIFDFLYMDISIIVKAILCASLLTIGTYCMYVFIKRRTHIRLSDNKTI